MNRAPIVHNADGNPLGPRACDFNVIPLGDTNAHGIPEDFRVEPIPTPVHPEPPRPQAERSRDTHQCSACPATGQGVIQPPGWQWFGSRLLCTPCSEARMKEDHTHG